MDFLKNLKHRITSYCWQIKNVVHDFVKKRDVGFEQLLILVLSSYIVIKIFIGYNDLLDNDKFHDIIPWEAIIAFVTALAWSYQSKVNKEQLKLEKRRAQEKLLDYFKTEEIKEIRILFNGLVAHFRYSYKECLEMNQKGLWNSSMQFVSLLILGLFSFKTYGGFQYNDKIRSDEMTKERQDAIKRANQHQPDDLGIVEVKSKFVHRNLFFNPVISKQNLTHFDEDGNLYHGENGRIPSKRKEAPLKKLNENEFGHEIIKSAASGRGCLYFLVDKLKKIEKDFSDFEIRKEALEFLFIQEFCVEFIQIMMRAFWFESEQVMNEKSSSPSVKKAFKEYKLLQQDQKKLKELRKLIKRLGIKNMTSAFPLTNF